MHFRTFSAGIAACLFPFMALAAQPCDNNCILKKGASTVTAKIIEHQKAVNPPQDSACPADGSATYDSLAQGRGSISDSESTVESLIRSISKQYENLKADNQRCGSCRQKNVVSIYTTSVPAKIRFAAECSNMPTSVIEKEFDHKVEIASYLARTLKGSNQDGQYLAQQCPDPCSYYITSARTPLINDQERLTLAVQCGQPRAGFILTAAYDYKVGIVHSWTCSSK
jgi:hypothetical protein